MMNINLNKKCRIRNKTNQQKFQNFYIMSIKYTSKSVLLFIILTGICSMVANTVLAQTETMSAGSYIINMGAPQTIGSALKPYGLIYQLTKNHKVPIRWVINPAKGKDGVDFTFNGVSYSGGPFIVPAEFRTAAVNAVISSYQSQGVVGVTTNAPLTVPVYAVLGTAIRWTLDAANGRFAIPYLSDAGIPSSAYGFKDPQNLNNCDDLYIMPHAEPTSSTHGNLVTWNNTHRGSIWVGCKAGSELDINVGKFLSNNGLVPEENHGDLSGGVTYDHATDPVMQFLGTGAHLQSSNGAEQIYYPNASAWRTTTKVGIYQTNPSVAANLRKAIIAWGPGFGDTNRGWVCMHAGHDLSKTNDVNMIAAVRAFHNFSLLAAIKRTVYPELTGVPNTLTSGTGTPLSYTLTPAGGSFTTQWTSSCGGTFSPSATAANVTFTPPAGITSCMISVMVTENSTCTNVRTFFASKVVTIQCPISITPTVTNVTCNGGNNGAIAMNIIGTAAPYNWTWTRVSPAGTGTGTGTTISNLTAGSYNVTVTSAAGCQSTFTSLVAQPNGLVATPTVTSFQCAGQGGAISLNLTGGTTPRTYSWTGPSSFTSTSQNISNLQAGTYNVTVTDANNCTTSTTATLAGPSVGMSLSYAANNPGRVVCNGQSNGFISMTVSGGTAPYSYLWSNGATVEDPTGLTAGTYNVVVTDANGCTVSGSTTVTQPDPLVLSLVSTNPTCPPGTTPPLGTNGAINLTVTGGNTSLPPTAPPPNPYTFAWTTVGGSGLSPAAEDQTGLSAGTYSVTVTDLRGCTATTSATLVNTTGSPVAPSTISSN